MYATLNLAGATAQTPGMIRAHVFPNMVMLQHTTACHTLHTWRGSGTPRLPISTINGQLRKGPGAWGRVRVGVNPTLLPVRFEAQAGSPPLNAQPPRGTSGFARKWITLRFLELQTGQQQLPYGPQSFLHGSQPFWDCHGRHEAQCTKGERAKGNAGLRA